jgi:hypothetical protein
VARLQSLSGPPGDGCLSAAKSPVDPGRWRKRKDIARVRLMDGTIHSAEIHWYEAAGIGRKEYKIKYLL